MDVAARQYVHELVGRLRAALGDDLVAVYLTGSAVLGDWRAGASDVDVMVVCRSPLSAAAKLAVVEPLRQRALPCPARGLELVVYERAAVGAPAVDLAFEVNLNTGPAMTDHVSFDPAQEPRHWFVIDVAIARDRGRPLCGPAPAEVIGPVAREVVLAALADSLRWHRDNEPEGPSAVLNACRAWCFAATGQWVSKSDAARWAVEQGTTSVVDEALAMRTGAEDGELDRRAVRELLDEVERRLGRS